jgi:hypothetical protein
VDQMAFDNLLEEPRNNGDIIWEHIDLDMAIKQLK